MSDHEHEPSLWEHWHRGRSIYTWCSVCGIMMRRDDNGVWRYFNYTREEEDERMKQWHAQVGEIEP